MKRLLILIVFALAASYTLSAQQVTADRIVRAIEEPKNWLTY